MTPRSALLRNATVLHFTPSITPNRSIARIDSRRLELEDGTDDRRAGGAADLEDVRALEVGGGAVLEEELEDEREGVAGGDVDGERGGAPVDAGDDGAGAHVVPIPVIGPAPRVHWSTLP